ncbi:hypothetical protein HQ531_10455 [bacterium]|nr:hypothetical protein [bacterium]
MIHKSRIFSGFKISLIFCILHGINYAKIHHLKVPSVALSDSNRVIVATPSSFDINKKGGYPFIVMLHGWSGDETQWEDDADLQGLSDRHNILLVLPNGGYDGWWLDSKLLDGSNYDTHLHEEITIWIVVRFNGSPNASQHGIMGLSMGGFGAFLQALKYPDDYAAAASLSGVMDITRRSEKFGLKKALGSYPENSLIWESNNPLHLTKKVSPAHGPAFLHICGRDDFTYEENQALNIQMDQKGYSVTFQEEAGAHTHLFWKTYVGSAIEFIVSNFQNEGKKRGLK